MSIYQQYPEGYYVYYYIRNKDSLNGTFGTPYYVGKGSGNRAWKSHTKTVKTPKDKSFIHIVCKGLTEEQAFMIEKLHIKLWGRIDIKTGVLLNKTAGGEGASGTIRSPETREKIRKTLQSKPGRKHTEKTKKLISERNKQRVLSPETQTRMLSGFIKGRGPKSQQTKNNISKALVGRNFSEDHKASLKNAWKHRNKTPHNKETKNPRACCIQCKKDLSIYHLGPHQKYWCS